MYSPAHRVRIFLQLEKINLYPISNLITYLISLTSVYMPSRFVSTKLNFELRKCVLRKCVFEKKKKKSFVFSESGRAPLERYPEAPSPGQRKSNAGSVRGGQGRDQQRERHQQRQQRARLRADLRGRRRQS